MTFFVAGAVIVSSAIGANASSKAAKSQAAATGQAADLEREMFERNIELNAPFRESGLAAQNRLMTLLGLAPPEALSGGGGGFGGVAGMVAGAARNAMGQPGLQVDRSSPDFGRYARDFSMADYQADPGYAFRMSEGMKGLERSAAARGGLLSGASMKGIQRFGQDLASQEYQNAFNRYQANRAAQLNPLQSLAGVGQTTSQQLGTAGTQMAGNVGNLMTSGAAARASGYVGGANALTGALNTGLNYYQGQQYLNALRPPTPTVGYSGQGPIGYAP